MNVNFSAIKFNNFVNFKKAENSAKNQYFTGKHKNIPHDSFELSSSKKAEEEEKTIFDRKKVKSTFRKMGINIKKCDDGMYILSGYRQPEGKTFKDLGIDEDELLKYVKEINEDADFKNSNAESTGSITTINGKADFGDSNIKRLENLRYVEKDLLLIDSQVEEADNLEYVGRDLFAQGSSVRSLKSIIKIGRDAYFNYSNIEDAPNLEYIGRDVYVNHSKIKLPSRTKIRGRIIS